MRVADAEGSFAMIDLVAHLYRGTSDDRRALATIWTRYSDATEEERRKKGFEIVRMHHATLTRMFRDGTRRERRDRDRNLDESQFVMFIYAIHPTHCYFYQ